jgi:hypothetical protein
MVQNRLKTKTESKDIEFEVCEMGKGGETQILLVVNAHDFQMDDMA